jgi:hypothetical protein
MIEKITKLLDSDRRIFIEIPVVHKTFGATEYRNLVKQICTTYAVETTRIFGSLSSANDVDFICNKIIKDFEQTLMTVFNNSTFASKETESEFYMAIATVTRHIHELAVDRNFLFDF